MYQGDGDYTVNFQEVVKDKRFSHITRLLAADLINNPYITPGDFFKELTSSEIDVLLPKADLVFEGGEGDELDEMIILAMMLSQAEGIPIESEEQILETVKLVAIMIHGVSLGKKDIVEVEYDLLSFGDEMQDHIVFRRKS